MSELLFELAKDFDNIQTNLESKVNDILKHNKDRYYEDREAKEAFDKESKIKLYKKFLKETNKEVKNISKIIVTEKNFGFEFFHGINSLTGEVKNKGLILRFYENEAKKVLKEQPYLLNHDYQTLKNHLLFLGDVMKYLVAIKERKFILDRLEELTGNKTGPVEGAKQREFLKWRVKDHHIKRIENAPNEGKYIKDVIAEVAKELGVTISVVKKRYYKH